MRADEFISENLRKWFKEKWVRFGPDGKIRGACARGDDSEGKPKCLPQAKAHALGKKGRKYAASKKRREDPNPERRGPAKNVATKKKSNEGVAEGSDNLTYIGNCTDDDVIEHIFGDATNFAQAVEEHGDEFTIDDLVVKYDPESDVHSFYYKKKGVAEDQAPMFTPEGKCPHCGGALFEFSMINEKKDACYYKVKSRYKVWPSAYASGALVKCRKKGAKNWGTGGKKNEGIEEGNDQEFHTGGSKGLPMPGTYEEENNMFKRHGSRRITAMTNEEQLDEKWSEKYKRSINCNNPKGFSQRAHCQGKKKK